MSARVASSEVSRSRSRAIWLTHAEASVTAGHSLKQAYDAAYATLAPRYGNWVIFDHCMPFDVSRAYDEAKGLDHPRIWTAERDIEMWKALEQAK